MNLDSPTTIETLTNLESNNNKYYKIPLQHDLILLPTQLLSSSSLANRADKKILLTLHGNKGNNSNVQIKQNSKRYKASSMSRNKKTSIMLQNFLFSKSNSMCYINDYNTVDKTNCILDHYLSSALSLSGSLGTYEFFRLIDNSNLDLHLLPSKFVDEIILEIFKFHQIPQYLNIPLERLYSFILMAKRNYNNVPYHNFMHGYFVLHMCHMVICGITKNSQYYSKTSYKTFSKPPLSSFDICGLTIAALCHDIQHDGKSNLYHIRLQKKNQINVINDNKNSLAETGNSYQEKIHVSETLDIIKKSKIFDNIPFQKQKKLCKYITELILSTDMEYHSKMMDISNSLIKRSQFHKDNFLKRNKQKSNNANNCVTESNILFCLILHCCDISSATMGLQFSIQSSHLVMLEFSEQIKAEKYHGIQLTKMLDIKPRTKQEAKLHLSFIDTFVLPAWKTLRKLVHFQDIYFDNIKRTQRYWYECLNSNNKDIIPY